MMPITKNIANIIHDGCRIMGALKRESRSSCLEVSRESEVLGTKAEVEKNKKKREKQKKKVVESHVEGGWT